MVLFCLIPLFLGVHVLKLIVETVKLGTDPLYFLEDQLKSLQDGVELMLPKHYYLLVLHLLLLFALALLLARVSLLVPLLVWSLLLVLPVVALLLPALVLVVLLVARIGTLIPTLVDMTTLVGVPTLVGIGRHGDKGLGRLSEWLGGLDLRRLGRQGGGFLPLDAHLLVGVLGVQLRWGVMDRVLLGLQIWGHGLVVWGLGCVRVHHRLHVGLGARPHVHRHRLHARIKRWITSHKI